MLNAHRELDLPGTTDGSRLLWEGWSSVAPGDPTVAAVDCRPDSPARCCPCGGRGSRPAGRAAMTMVTMVVVMLRRMKKTQRNEVKLSAILKRTIERSGGLVGKVLFEAHLYVAWKVGFNSFVVSRSDIISEDREESQL